MKSALRQAQGKLATKVDNSNAIGLQIKKHAKRTRQRRNSYRLTSTTSCMKGSISIIDKGQEPLRIDKFLMAELKALHETNCSKAIMPGWYW